MFEHCEKYCCVTSYFVKYKKKNVFHAYIRVMVRFKIMNLIKKKIIY